MLFLDVGIDRKKSIICQDDTREPLKYLLLGPGMCDSKIEAYRSFLKNVEQFKAMNSLPTAIIFGEHESAESKSCFLAQVLSFQIQLQAPTSEKKRIVLRHF